MLGFWCEDDVGGRGWTLKTIAHKIGLEEVGIGCSKEFWASLRAGDKGWRLKNDCTVEHKIGLKDVRVRGRGQVPVVAGLLGMIQFLSYDLSYPWSKSLLIP